MSTAAYENIVDGLIVTVGGLLLTQLVWLILRADRVRQERNALFLLIDEWLAETVRIARRTREVLLRFHRPWLACEQIVRADRGDADVPEFPLIRVDRPDLEHVLLSKHALVRRFADPLSLLRLNSSIRLIGCSLQAVINLSIEVAKDKPRLISELPVVETIAGEIGNSIGLLSRVLKIAEELEAKRLPLTKHKLAAEFDRFVDLPPLVAGSYECRPADSPTAAPTRVDVVQKLVDTTRGRERHLRLADSDDPPEQAYPDHDWRLLD